MQEFFSFWYASFTYVSNLLLRLDQKRTKTTPALHTSDHSAEVNPVIESIENARHEAVAALLTTTVCLALNSIYIYVYIYIMEMSRIRKMKCTLVRPGMSTNRIRLQ